MGSERDETKTNACNCSQIDTKVNQVRDLLKIVNNSSRLLTVVNKREKDPME